MPRAAPPGSRASPSAATPVRRGMGKGRGEGRRVWGGGGAPPPRLAPGGGGVAASGVCPSPRPALPATSLEVGPRVRGGGRPVRLPPTPPPVAPATTASPRPADPARRGSSGRVSRAVRRDGRRLPRRGAARPAPSPPAPPALGRSASAGRRRSSRRSGPVARSPGASPRPSGPRGPVPPPPPPPTPPGGSCVSVRVLPPSRPPPARWAPSFPSEPLPPALCPRWWWLGGRVPGSAGAGRGAPPPPVVGGERPGEVRRSRARTGRRVRARRWGKGSAPSRGDGWGRLSGARRGPPGGGRPARGGGPPCVTGRQRRGPRARPRAGTRRSVVRVGAGARRAPRPPPPSQVPSASRRGGLKTPGGGRPSALGSGRSGPRGVGRPLPSPPDSAVPRGAGVARGVARRGHGRRGRREGATRRSSRGPWPCAARARAPPASPGEGGNPPGACGVPAPTLARGRRVPRRVKPLPAPPVCCFPSDSAGRRQPPPTSSRLRGGSRRRRDVCRASGGSPAEAKRSTQLVRLLAVDHSARASMKNAASCEN